MLKSEPTSCWLLRPADELNIMRDTQMRQAHIYLCSCVFGVVLRMRMKQKEIYFQAGCAAGTKKPAHGGLSYERGGYPWRRYCWD